MKKIAFVLPKMALGGTEKSLLSLLDTLNEEEYDITILLFEKTGVLLDQIPQWVHIEEVADYGLLKQDFSRSPFELAPHYIKQGKPIRAMNILVRHIWFRLTKNRYSYYSYVMKDFRYKDSFDIAIAYLGPDDFLTAYVLFCTSAQEKIQWIHFDVSKYVFNKRTSNSLYKYYDKINVVSEGAKEALVKLLPQYSEKIYYVKNKISAKRCKELALADKGFTDDFYGIRIITVGRLSEEKGQDIIPEVASLLKENGLNYRWYIIGDGVLRKKIEEKIQKYDISNEVVILGAKNNPYPFYKEADIYVQTSLHEGYGLSLAEAKIFNLAIVSTRCSGTDDLLKDYNAIIIDRMPKEFENAIYKISKGKNYA